eukprot:12992-Prymnesium_polylepis.1
MTTGTSPRMVTGTPCVRSRALATDAAAVCLALDTMDGCETAGRGQNAMLRMRWLAAGGVARH